MSVSLKILPRKIFEVYTLINVNKNKSVLDYRQRSVVGSEILPDIFVRAALVVNRCNLGYD